jgi:protein-S-isoprenylcysteine O-methyltransferase Ste14
MTDLDTSADTPASKPTALAIVSVTILIIVISGLVFGFAAYLQWPLLSFYFALMIATVAINLACLMRWNPELIWRRVGLKSGAKSWDIAFLMAWFAPTVIAIFVVAYDTATGIIGATGAAWFVGLLIFVGGWALSIWAMVVNPFFEKTVRIQTEHEHHVIDNGPYAYVRHPGYVGFIGWLISTPVLLGSIWAFVPALLAVAGLVFRTALEDRTLQAELAGYDSYTARVRFRLVPGIW